MSITNDGEKAADLSISTLLSPFSFFSTIAKRPKAAKKKPSSMIFWQITPFDSRFAQSPSSPGDFFLMKYVLDQ